MKKSDECEVATHIGPESCGAAREDGVEALRGACGPGIQPRKELTPGRRRCKEKRKASADTILERQNRQSVARAKNKLLPCLRSIRGSFTDRWPSYLFKFLQ
jgi:hypothetical protein